MYSELRTEFGVVDNEGTEPGEENSDSKTGEDCPGSAVAIAFLGDIRRL